MTGRRRLWVAVAMCAVALVLGACSTSTPSAADVTKALVASGYTRAEARCLTAAYERLLSSDELRDVASRGGAGVPTRKVTKLSEALAACSTSEAPSTTTAPPAPSPSITAPAFGTSTPSTLAPGFSAPASSTPSTSTPSSSPSSSSTVR